MTTTVVLAAYAGDTAGSVLGAFFQGFAGMFVLTAVLLSVANLLAMLSRFRRSGMAGDRE